jgi:hypothetical protein
MSRRANVATKKAAAKKAAAKKDADVHGHGNKPKRAGAKKGVKKSAQSDVEGHVVMRKVTRRDAAKRSNDPERRVH